MSDLQKLFKHLRYADTEDDIVPMQDPLCKEFLKLRSVVNTTRIFALLSQIIENFHL